MPVHNGGKVLQEAINSILSQSYSDFELIISDNGSTDDTPEVCRSFELRDARVKFHRVDTNRGAAWNFNNVFHLARGEYFKWAAADDICASEYLAQCVDVLDGDPLIVWCHSRSRRVGPDGEMMPPPYDDEISYSDPLLTESRFIAEGRNTAPTRQDVKPHHRFRAVLLGENGTIDVFGLIRADAMRKTSLQLPVYGGDKVFVAELSLLGRYEEVPEVLFYKRILASGSGALATASEQQRWIDPSRSARAARLRLFRAYVDAIHRASLRKFERVHCYLVLLRYLLQVRKWRGVVSKTMSGAGTGGGYLSAAQTMEARQDSDAPSMQKSIANTARNSG